MAWWSAPVQTFDRPADLGGPTANMPVTDYTVVNGVARELLGNWFGPSGVGPRSIVDNFGSQAPYDNGWTYEGDVFSIQLSIRPGYVVTPDVLIGMGMQGDEVPPFG